MAAARPLREVFTDLTGDEGARHADPAQLLRDTGHADLPDVLVSEAVISFADTAPVEVAEHLAPYVAANSAVPPAEMEAATDIDMSGWVEALATAPAAVDLDSPDPADGLDEPPDLTVAEDHSPTSDEHSSYADVEFGTGFRDDGGAAGPLDALDETSHAEASYAEAEGSDGSGAAVEAGPVPDDTVDESVWGAGEADDQPVDDGEESDLT